MGQERLEGAAREPSLSQQTSFEVTADDRRRGLAALHAGTPPAALSPAAVLHAQRLVGNGALARALTVQRTSKDGSASPARTDGAQQAVTSAEQPAHEEESEEARPKPDVVVPNPLDIDEGKAEDDWKKLLVKLADVPTLNVEGFRGPMRRYVDCAKKRDQEGAHQAMSQALEFIGSCRLFEVNNKRYERMTKDGAKPSQEQLDKAAEESATRSNLWSKMNSYFSISRAQGSGGLSLEASVGGHLFDGLDFGMDYKSNPILADQWKRVSMNYVERVRGEVHAAIFREVHPTSVLTKTEWPIIREHLKTRRVTALLVHVFDFVHTLEGDKLENDKTDYGEIEEKTKQPIVIMSEEDWNTKLAHFNAGDTKFADDQKKAHESEKAVGEARIRHEKGDQEGEKKFAGFGPALEDIRKGKQLTPVPEAKKKAPAGLGKEDIGPVGQAHKGWVKSKIDEFNKLAARYVEEKK